ncbi:echinoderm microtubule-associated protein-like 1 isoform X1 [Syngnathus scovelli]|uniref:echinoderm microtubule-associated protein-like 1 isoform X1 n=1 Tax=Syngnathus scovelli TaxID=161590 RepID=UPI002110BA14|nr:echinoderm microtubule-associated protein-like 1 isoform X1 [Syngnathus scovelli]
MDGVSGSRGGLRRTERVCSRQERKRRNTAKVAEEGPAGPQRFPRDYSSSTSSGSHDGRSSAASNLDVADRLTYLEQRMQMQEDEIQLLKMTLADVLKRLNISEEHQAANATALGRRTSGTKGRPVSLGLPPRAPMGSSGVANLRKSSTLPSGATCRNYSPTPPHCGVKSPAGSVKDSPCKTSKTRPSSSASSCASIQEGISRSKEELVSLGMRRVTHSKVTMQIYLSPLARKTGSSETTATSAPAVPAAGGSGGPGGTQHAKSDARRSSSSMLNLQKTSTNVTSQQNTQHDANSHKSPIKSSRQYFQICY